MPSTRIVVDYFGDPACPWDFSAEGARLRLDWRYGTQLEWRRHMVVLSRDSGEYGRRGVSTADLAEGRRTIRDLHGMPIDVSRAARHLATVEACRAVVAVRLHAPDREEVFLRRVRVLSLTERRMIDEDEVLHGAARDVGVDPADLDRWRADPEVEAALALDMELARTPRPAAVAMPERLARTPEGGWRYTCPSYVFQVGERALDAPGFQPSRVYEVLLANLAPQADLRPTPTDVQDVLRWAQYPLATVEVATIMDRPVAEVRPLLQAGARRIPAADDAYWDVG